MQQQEAAAAVQMEDKRQQDAVASVLPGPWKSKCWVPQKPLMYFIAIAPEARVGFGKA